MKTARSIRPIRRETRDLGCKDVFDRHRVFGQQRRVVDHARGMHDRPDRPQLGFDLKLCVAHLFDVADIGGNRQDTPARRLDPLDSLDPAPKPIPWSKACDHVAP